MRFRGFPGPGPNLGRVRTGALDASSGHVLDDQDGRLIALILSDGEHDQ
jgi:hypothetical protein